jgi:PAS domain S-box-containing protein
MNVDIFARQVQALNWRLTEMYKGADLLTPPSIELLPAAFKELATVAEELEVAVEELCQQNEQLATAHLDLEAERRRYQELFEFVPDAYLVTDARGKIQEANRAATQMLNVSQEHLVGKPFAVFVASEERWNFRTELNRKSQGERSQNWEVRLQPRGDNPFDAVLTVSAVRDVEGKPTILRWLLRKINPSTQQPQSETCNRLPLTSQRNHYNPKLERPIHVYSKGEAIALNPRSIWQVRDGLVKLTTLSDSGEEVLVGLAGPSMPFGVDLTSLITYQATALSQQVQLVEISLEEIVHSPDLAQALLPHINRRLRQSELLLAIFGKRRVQDRLQQLLLLLKQEIGEPTKFGTRLSVRLTHEDLANACCTTRVTMTRVLGELQQQGKIIFDCDRRLILTETLP